MITTNGTYLIKVKSSVSVYVRGKYFPPNHYS